MSHLRNVVTVAAELHAAWVKLERMNGWKLGPEFSVLKRESPLLCEFSDLPEARIREWVEAAKRVVEPCVRWPMGPARSDR